jgi:hypothetical protein
MKGSHHKVLAYILLAIRVGPSTVVGQSTDDQSGQTQCEEDLGSERTTDSI